MVARPSPKTQPNQPTPTAPTPGLDWLCNPPDNPTATTWDTIKTSARASSSRPPTNDELSRLSAAQTQKEAVQFCRDYFAEEEEEYDGDDDEDMETEFFEFFAGTLEKVGDLAELYKKRWEQGEFVCLVCAGTGVKVWRKFANLVALVQHSLTISNTKRRCAHRAFGRAVCHALAWDAARLPSIKIPSSGDKEV